MNSIAVVTWNILGDTFQRDARLRLIAKELAAIDIFLVQEVVQPNTGGPNTAEILSKLTGMKIASFALGGTNNFVTGEEQATAILTRLEITVPDIKLSAPDNQESRREGMYSQYAAAILKSVSGRQVFVSSVHLPWGGSNENARLKHVVHLNSQIEEKVSNLPADSISIIAGDFNTTPMSDTIRFLRGELGSIEPSTFWVDAWDACGEGSGFTWDPKSANTNLARTAIQSGIKEPSHMPPRRIDYIFVKGWVHGRPGNPKKVALVGQDVEGTTLFPSDHFGIKVLIWDPAN